MTYALTLSEASSPFGTVVLPSLVYTPDDPVAIANAAAFLRRFVVEMGFEVAEPPISLAAPQGAPVVAEVQYATAGLRVHLPAQRGQGVLINDVDREPPRPPAGWWERVASSGDRCAVIVAVGIDLRAEDGAQELSEAASRHQVVTGWGRVTRRITAPGTVFDSLAPADRAEGTAP